MADATETTLAGAAELLPSQHEIVFGGETRNMAIGMSMVGGGLAAFVAGLTHTFFAEATAWTFVAWGLLFLYGDLLLSTRRFIVADTELKIQIPLRPWGGRKQWAWTHIYRMDVVMDRRNTHRSDCQIQIYHQLPGEITIEREDRDFDPELAALVIERAHLKPESKAARLDLNNLPFGQSAVFTWKR
jgi:hypothetical protein